MRSIIALDINQLKRVEAAISDFKTQSPANQSRKCQLLGALEREAAVLRQCCKQANRHTTWGEALAA